MNTNMWDHTFTAKHIAVLQETLNFKVISPISKLLACGDTGMGAMAEPRTIVQEAMIHVNSLTKRNISQTDDGD